jgi:hypothetical protein
MIAPHVSRAGGTWNVYCRQHEMSTIDHLDRAYKKGRPVNMEQVSNYRIVSKHYCPPPIYYCAYNVHSNTSFCCPCPVIYPMTTTTLNNWLQSAGKGHTLHHIFISHGLKVIVILCQRFIAMTFLNLKYILTRSTSRIMQRRQTDGVIQYVVK